VKKIAIIGICVLMTGLFASAGAASPTKVMINVVEESGDISSGAMIKDTEMLIARELINNQLDVLTSDDLSAGKGLSEKEVTAARTGSMTEMRKAAAINGAAYIVSAKARTQVSEENVLNMTMKKAVTTFSYRIVNAATGRTVDMDSLSFSSADRAAEKRPIQRIKNSPPRWPKESRKSYRPNYPPNNLKNWQAIKNPYHQNHHSNPK
jgi:hypothetical protein